MEEIYKEEQMKYDMNYSLIPEHMREGIKRYLENGIRLGSFLNAVLENNLVQSIALADEINITKIVDWAKFLYNEMPMGSWGSKEKVNAWIKEKRIKQKGGKNEN